jgi:transcription factor 1
LLTGFAASDDILGQLSPSLTKHEGCTIVDLFPGEGLWSRKIHEAVQPGAHYILEPDNSPHHAAWKAKSQEPKSNYIMSVIESAPDNKLDFAALKKIMDECVEGKVPIGDTWPETGINHSILFLVNTARFPFKTRMNKLNRLRSPSDALNYYLGEGFRYRSKLQRAGIVRTLFWCGQNDKFCSVPRIITQRSTANVDLQEGYFAQEVAGQSSFEQTGRRLPILDVESAVRVALRMKGERLELPSSRRSTLHKAVLASFDAADSTGERPSVLGLLEETHRLEERLASGGMSLHVPLEPGVDKRIRRHSSDYLKLQELRQQIDDMTGYKTGYAPQTQSVGSVVYALANLYDHERSMRKKYPDGDKLELRTAEERATMEQYVEAVANAWASHSGREARRTSSIRLTTDSAEAMSMSTTVLDWDLRPFEPLDCRDDEFDPPLALALLDYQPRPQSSILGENGRTIMRTAFTTTLRHNLNKPLLTTLDGISHGCSDALIPQCPSITDPARGGHVHLDDIRIRLLTYEHLLELNRAWDRWPFKVPDTRLYALIMSGQPDLT